MTEQLTPKGYSKRVFGREHRIDVWREVIKRTEQEPHSFLRGVMMLDLQLTAGIPPSSTQVELKMLKQLGMIEPVPDTDTRYQRTDSPTWDIAKAALASYQALFEQGKAE